MSTGVITHENRGLRVSIPAGAVRHSTRKSAGRTLEELPGGSWAAARPVFFDNEANVVPRVSSCRRLRRLVTVADSKCSHPQGGRVRKCELFSKMGS